MSSCVPDIQTPGFPPSGNVGGDLQGALPNPALAPNAIHGKPVETSTESTDELLIWDAGTSTLRRMTYATLTGNLVTSVNGATGAISGLLEATNNLSDVANVPIALANIGAAPLASPAFTGTPTAPTAPDGTDNGQIATTAFVQSALAGAGGGPQVWGGSGDGTAPGAGAILTYTFFGSTFGSSVNNGYRVSLNCIATQLQVHLLDAQPGGGVMSVEVYINGAPSGLAVVIPPGSFPGWYTVNLTIALAIGDIIYLRQQNHDLTLPGATLGQFSMLVQ